MDSWFPAIFRFPKKLYEPIGSCQGAYFETIRKLRIGQSPQVGGLAGESQFGPTIWRKLGRNPWVLRLKRMKFPTSGLVQHHGIFGRRVHCKRPSKVGPAWREHVLRLLHRGYGKECHCHCQHVLPPTNDILYNIYFLYILTVSKFSDLLGLFGSMLQLQVLLIHSLGIFVLAATSFMTISCMFSDFVKYRPLLRQKIRLWN